jgi:hypothetical protein
MNGLNVPGGKRAGRGIVGETQALFTSDGMLVDVARVLAKSGELGQVPLETRVSLSVSPAGRSVRVAWETECGLDSVGFHIYRAETEDGPRHRLNAALIPSHVPGSSAGVWHTFYDISPLPGVPYYYWLHSVSRSGQIREHGPVCVMLPR